MRPVKALIRLSFSEKKSSVLHSCFTSFQIPTRTANISLLVSKQKRLVESVLISSELPHEKTLFGVSDQVVNKPGCTAKKDG